ncbi:MULTISPECIES: hypothetical protein [Methanoculleus]|nr:MULTISPECIES: hypothetical protein [Methanoculleus]UYU17484.1 hypothetical protein OH143_07120 [Methanoculleus submarinus]
MPEATDLVVGGGRMAGGRCIIPLIRAFSICAGGTAVVSLTPVALLFAEGEREYLALLPGAPRGINDLIGELRGDIEREKEKCSG